MSNNTRLVTNYDPLRGGYRKAVWFVDTASEQTELRNGPEGRKEYPSRYGPSREYLANCFDVEDASAIVKQWNARVEDLNRAANTKLFVVRFYDGFDNLWRDVSKPLPYDLAHAIWEERTGNGTHHARFTQIDYYEIYPADSKMLFS